MKEIISAEIIPGADRAIRIVYHREGDPRRYTDFYDAGNSIAATNLIEYLNGTADALEQQQTAIRNFVNKLDECSPHIDNAFFMAHNVRGGNYDGPTYEHELKALRQFAGDSAPHVCNKCGREEPEHALDCNGTHETVPDKSNDA